MSVHNWIRSTLGHGEFMCSKCAITNREAAVLGLTHKCDMSDPEPTVDEKALRNDLVLFINQRVRNKTALEIIEDIGKQLATLKQELIEAADG